MIDPRDHQTATSSRLEKLLQLHPGYVITFEDRGSTWAVVLQRKEPFASDFSTGGTFDIAVQALYEKYLARFEEEARKAASRLALYRVPSPAGGSEP